MAGQQQSPHTPQQKPIPRSIMIGWLLVGMALVWNLTTWWTKTPPEVTIPYTTFLEQVRADNVKNVLIVSDTIERALVKPLQWPQRASAAAPSPPQAATSSATSSAEPAAPPLPAYRTFLTTVPVAVGDPNLLALLESHKVIVNAASPTTPWFLELLVNWFPMLLLVGFLWWTGSQAAKKQAGVFGLGRSKARQYTADDSRHVRGCRRRGRSQGGIAGRSGFPAPPAEVPRLGRAHPAWRAASRPSGRGEDVVGSRCRW